MTFLEPLHLRILVGLLFLLLISAALGQYVRRRRRVAAALGDAEVIRQLLGYDLGRAPRSQLLLILAAAALLVSALVDPAFQRASESDAGPLVLLLDASGSMLAQDAPPNRLEVQRRLARELVEHAESRPIGLVAFAGRAFTLTPPTRDGVALEMFLSTLDPTIVTQSGSALEAATRQGIALLTDRAGEGGTVVLFTDGGATDDREAALAAAELAARNRIELIVVGIGTDAGAPVPAFDPATGSASGHLKEPGGELLISRREDEFLRSLARQGRGRYLPAEDAESIEAFGLGRASQPASPDNRLTWGFWAVAIAFLMLLLEPLTRRGNG